jgi:rod shape-determining protein MreC
MIFQYKNYQNSYWVNSSNNFSGSIFEKIHDFESYFSLREQNDLLASENAKLRAQLPNTLKLIDGGYIYQSDSLFKQRYTYQKAKVIQNTIYKKDNFLILNLGEYDGIKPEMGIITDKGVIGFVVFTSKNYSTAISILNSKASVSVRVAKNNAVGTMIWDGKDHTLASILDIPLTTPVEIGDTLVSSGFSAYYPEGIMIGLIIDKKVGDNQQMHNLKIKLFEDFNKLNYVYIIQGMDVNELKELEEKTTEFLNGN